ncbi:MAG: cadherin-like beta sandwich domain-containing protein, partial [Bacilli bacterium]|nr:cadherin-like beta sandwich domain-containing protein [Bacilli bacterium]
MKRIKIWLVLLLSACFIPAGVSAASGSISVTGPSTAVQGNKVTVTVKLSASKGKLGSWQMDLNYDKNYLKLVSASSEGGGSTMVSYSSSGAKSKSYTFTFEARKTGSTKVSVSSYEAYDFDTMDEMTLTSSSKTIKIMTQSELESTYSSNAALSSLEVTGYEINPKFNASTLEYNVEVENDVTTATITGKKADSNASVSGLNTVELNEGNNRFEVIVTAQKGNTQTYVVNIYRKEKNPINVSFSGSDYTVIRKSDELEDLSTFEGKEITYQGEEIPALYNEVTDTTLIGLKDADGKIHLAIIDEDVVGLYNEIRSNSVVLNPQKLPESSSFDKYIRKNIKYDDMTVEGYALNKKSNVVIIYAENMETGDLAYYQYDTENQTVQLYSDEV